MAKRATTLKAREAVKQEEAFEREEMAPDAEAVSTLNDKQRAKIKSLYERDGDMLSRIQTISMDRSEMFANAKSDGFDPARLKAAFKKRRMDPDTRSDNEALEDLYFEAIDESDDGDSEE